MTFDYRARFVWALARAAARIFYRLDRLGPPLPDGPVLLVANHPNALMDPAVVAAAAGRPIRFLAKSTLFAGHPLAFVIRWSRAIPVYRRMDQGVDLARNVEMFEAVGRALDQGDAVCLFPEGLSHSTGRLEALRTGAARIVVAAAARGTRVAIVPVGLNFDHKARFRSRCTAAFGPAFYGDDLAGPGDDPAAVRALTDRIARRLRDLIVEADPRTEAEIVARADALYAAARGRGSEADRLVRRRVIAAGMEWLRDRDRARYEELLGKIRDFDARLARFGLRQRDLHLRVSRWAAARFAGRELVYGMVLWPIAAAGLVVFAIPYWLTGRLAGSRRYPLEARGSARAILGLLVYGAWTLLLALAAGPPPRGS